MSAMKEQEKKLTVKEVKGPLERARRDSIWKRFDRLQRSLRPLRKGHHIARGVHYER